MENMIEDWGSLEKDARVQLLKDVDATINTGIGVIDDFIRGIRPTDFFVIAADTGLGKTTLMRLIATSLAEHGQKTLFISLESYRGEMQDRQRHAEIMRLVPAHKRVSYSLWLDDPRKIPDSITQAASEASAKKYGGKIGMIYRTESFGILETIQAINLAAAQGYKAVVLDHLHYLDSDGRDNELQHIEKLARAINRAVNIARIPVIAASHLRKRGVGQKKSPIVPSIHDLHGSSEIAKRATAVMTVSRARVEAPSYKFAPTWFRIQKRRVGGIDDTLAMGLFNRHDSKYEQRYKLFEISEDRTSFEPLRVIPDWVRRENLAE